MFSEHYNFVGTKRTEKKFLIISVLKTPTDSKFTALRNTDNVDSSFYSLLTSI